MSAIMIHLGYLAEWEVGDDLANAPERQLALLYGWLTGRKFANDGSLPLADERMLRLLDAEIERRKGQEAGQLAAS